MYAELSLKMRLPGDYSVLFQEKKSNGNSTCYMRLIIVNYKGLLTKTSFLNEKELVPKGFFLYLTADITNSITQVLIS